MPDHLRVIARRNAPKQLRGTSIQVRFSPLGCFAALAMTRQVKKPFPPLRGRGLGVGGRGSSPRVGVVAVIDQKIGGGEIEGVFCARQEGFAYGFAADTDARLVDAFGVAGD